jgi:putative ABC transport system substrate-binding protein
MSGVGRREFVALLGGVAAAWPLTVSAQQASRLPIIGFLGSGSQTGSGHWLGAFMQRMRELGWIDGRTVAVDVRWAEGRNDRSAEIAAEFVRLNVDIIVTYGNEQSLIAKQATSVILIVSALMGDPLGAGLVASLAHPGRNLTGLSPQNLDLAGKRLQFLREIVPALHRLAILFNVNNPSSALEVHIVESAARPLGVEVIANQIRRGDDIAPAFAMMKEAKADALFVVGDPLILVNATQIHTLALTGRLPTAHAAREAVMAGGLISYGPNFPDLFRRAADYVDRILRGAKPADMPVEQPTKYDLVINLTTAKALGLAIPETFLLRADEVIE